MASAASSQSVAGLTPSQAISSRNVGPATVPNGVQQQNNTGNSAEAFANQNGNLRPPHNPNNPNKNNNKNKKRQNKKKVNTTEDNNINNGAKSANVNNESNGQGETATDNNTPAAKKPNNKNKRNKNKNKNKNTNNAPEPSNGEGTATTEDNTAGKRRTRKNNRNAKGRKRYPWRRHVPPGACDPITLDAIVSLSYPPFALVATEPYVPVPEWPIPKEQQQQSSAEQKAKAPTKEDDEERHRRIIEEQWGKSFASTTTNASEEQKLPPETTAVQPERERHYHLYDGKALAYYLVSQLQFIDPLNRRDLTREELVNLDKYLRRHGFSKDVHVVEAYDAKGVSLSTAGAAAHTATGRMEILQQEARVLLNSLFVSNRNTTRALPEAQQQNPLQAQYAAYSQQQHHRHQQQANPGRRATANEDGGIYGDEHGLVIIDDDFNPGLRGNMAPFSETPDTEVSQVPGTLYSASHIASRYGHAATIREEAFPALAATLAPANIQQQQRQPPKKQLPSASSTLKLIGKTVKKTTPEEAQRQWEAREEARRKAVLSNLTFGSNPASWAMPEFMETQQQQQLESSNCTPNSQPSDAQIQRNRAFAEALDVTPATVRLNRSYKSGWARPTEAMIEFDEFGNELFTNYPDSLIIQARERMAQLLKLEKKWKAFLEDDTSASLPLNPMDRPMRAFVHEYSDFWRLQTESFDPEPKRYIHCVKMKDTSAPHPLLSDAARNWRGPRPVLSSMAQQAANPAGWSDHASQQMAGQTTRGQPSWKDPSQRVPLPLKPRSIEGAGVARTMPTSTDKDTDGGLINSMSNERFNPLFEGRERPKLDLQKRTLPLELPPFKTAVDNSEDIQKLRQRQAAKQQRKIEEEKNKMKVLEAAFASSDEEEEIRGAFGDDDSDWEEPQAMFPESDSE